MADRKIARITNGLIVLALIPTRLSSAGQISLVCKHEFKPRSSSGNQSNRNVPRWRNIGKINTYVARLARYKHKHTTKIQAKSYYLDRFWIIAIGGKFERSIARFTRELRTMQRWRAVIFEINALKVLEKKIKRI